MENYELYIPTIPKRKNNYFQKGNRPFNRGIPMKEWMDGRKIKRVLKYLDLGRKKGNEKLAGNNRIKIIAIKNGKLRAFSSAIEAEKILRCENIQISARNIRTVCNQKVQKIIDKKHNKIYFIRRKKAGGFEWFNADNVEKYKDKIILNIKP